MPRTPAPPRLWLFTDERLGGRHPKDPLWQAIARLPAGAGIVFRHYGWPPTDRAQLLARITRLARAGRLTLVIADPTPGNSPGRAPHRHLPAHAVRRSRRARGLTTAAAHNRRQLESAARAGAQLIFLSPVHPTRSHPDTRPLGPTRFGLILQQRSRRATRIPIIALGGITPHRWPNLRTLGATGWAAIDAWLP